jgi:hypothetical protein
MSPSINPGTVGATSYVVADSKGVVAALRLDVGTTPPFPAFTLRWSAATPGLEVILQRGAATVTLPVTDGDTLNDTTTVPTRRIVAGVTAVGAELVLDCTIRATAAAAVAEAWTVRALAASPQDWQVVQDDNAPADPTVTRIMGDPAAGFTVAAATLVVTGPTSATVREKDAVTLNAVPPFGTAAAPTVVPFPGPGIPGPVVSVRWTKIGASVPTTAFPSCSASPTKSFTAPAVYGARSMDVVEEVWFEAGCGGAPGFLHSTSTPRTLTVEPRPQHLALVLDRSGSMIGSRWDTAVTAARILTDLFVAVRAGVNGADRVELVVFEDPSGSWHAGPDPVIGPVLPLSDLGSARAAVCGTDFGSPGSWTPIGDGLIRAMDDLATLGTADDPRFTVLLLTDGRENSGAVVVDPNTPVPAGIARFATARQTGLARAAVNSRLALYTVGLGQTVQEDVLDALAVGGRGVFRHVLDVGQLGDALAQMVSLARDAHRVVPEPAGPNPERTALLDPGVSRLAIAVEWADAADTLELAWRRQDVAGAFAPLDVAVQQCPTHGFATVDVAEQFFGGDELAVPGTEWRITHRSGGAAVAIPDADLLVFVDLVLAADVVFDRDHYSTGQPMVLTCRLRFGDEAVTGARVVVELARPGESLGTFLARNGADYRPGQPAATDPQDPKGQMLVDLLRRLDLEGLPVVRPQQIFDDGTDELFDDAAHRPGPDGLGDYANRYGTVDREGTYTWRFQVLGFLPDGSAFSRVLTVSKWVGVLVHAPASQVDVAIRPGQGTDVVRVTVHPQDRRGELLGPFRPADVVFRAASCPFRPAGDEEVVDGVAYPVKGGTIVSQYDGGYRRELLCPAGEPGSVTVTVQGRDLPVVRWGQ